MNNTIIISPNHFSFSIIEDMQQICAPLFQYSGITLFVYGRFYDDGQCYVLTTHSLLHEYLFENQCILTCPISEKYITKKFHYLLPYKGPYQQVMHDIRSYFDMDHGFDLIERYEDYYDMFSFASNVNNTEVINFYFNNIDLLEKFKFYFKDKAKNLIKNSMKNKIFLPRHMRTNFQGIQGENVDADTKKQIFKNQINPSSYSLNGKYSHVTLTKREVEVLEYIVFGSTVKETATFINLSPRTIETFIDNIKNKLGLYKKSEIINAILKSDLPLEKIKT